MLRLVDILKQEGDNENELFFHNIDGRWYAFERSAFIATLMFSKSEIRLGMYPWTEDERTVNLPMAEIRPELLFSLELGRVSDSEVKLPFKIRPGRLKCWKSSMRKKYL